MQQRSASIVVDKSFCQALKAERLAALSMRYAVLVPSAFYYEVFTTASEKVRKTLIGLEEFRRADLPTLLRRETQSGKPTERMEQTLLPRKVNSEVLSPAWRLTPDKSAVVERYDHGLVRPSIQFWKAVIRSGVVGFSHEELAAMSASDKEFLTLCELLRDPDRIRKIAAELNFLHASIIDASWLHYRQYQAWILHGLILRRRYRCEENDVSELRIEHDLQDLEYLILGLHVGNLATCDTSEKLSKASLGWRFKLLRPEGRLLTPELA